MTPATPPGTRWWLYRRCTACGSYFMLKAFECDEGVKALVQQVLDVADPMAVEGSAADLHTPACREGPYTWEWVGNPGSSMRQHGPGPGVPEAM